MQTSDGTRIDDAPPVSRRRDDPGAPFPLEVRIRPAWRWAFIGGFTLALLVGLPLAHALIGEIGAILLGTFAFGFVVGRMTMRRGGAGAAVQARGPGPPRVNP